MKAFFAVLIAVTLAVPTIVSAAITIDGTADADYGSAIVTQKLGTSTSDNTLAHIDESNGSELDAAYGFVSNGVLHLVLAGNMDSDTAVFDKINIFFNVDGRAGDHTLGTNYNGSVDFGHFNRLGTGGAGDPNLSGPGLTFDTGFAANYWIGATLGVPPSGSGPGPTLFVNYEVICAGCFGAFLGQTTPSNAPPNNIFTDGTFGIQVALNNTNTLGVVADPSGCYSNGAILNPQAVRTGLELAIPLAAIGNPTGQVSICAFICDDQYETLYNQVLGPIWDGTVGFCQGSFPNSPSVDFSGLVGQHFFTLPVPPCNAFLVNPSSASYTSNGGPGSVTVAMAGACSWSVTSSVPWLTITSGGGPNSGSGVFNYSVATNTSVNTRTGTMTISGSIVTQNVTVTQFGITLPPLGALNVDGIAESAYGCPLAVQQIGTGFASNTSTNILPTTNGSELDAAYGLIINNVLYLTLAGNLEGNGNEFSVFFMTGPGGTNGVSSMNASNVSGAFLPLLGTQGFSFDPGFAPNYWIGGNGSGNPYTLFIDYAQLWPAGTNTGGFATNAYFLGSTTSTNGTLHNGNNPFGVQTTINNSNTGGVDGVSCSTNGLGAAQSIGAAQVRTGVELAIPLGALGSPTGAIYICTFISGGSPHTYLSNQFLPPIGTNNPAGGDCQGNLGNTNNLNLGTLPGGPHFFAIGPEMRVTSVAKAGSNINVSWLTESNSNLVYQLQSTHTLTTTTAWVNVGSPTNGTGLVISQTDSSAATNKPALFYRVQQAPLCQ